MEVPDARKLKALEEENRKLKKLMAETMLDASTLKEMLGKTFNAQLAETCCDIQHGPLRYRPNAIGIKLRAAGRRQMSRATLVRKWQFCKGGSDRCLQILNLRKILPTW
jgi:hypothetical protein